MIGKRSTSEIGGFAGHGLITAETGGLASEIGDLLVTG